jgi:hypothetical protein
MNKKTMIFIITLILIIFALIKFIFSQLCEPAKNNPVASIATSVVSSTASGVGSMPPSAPEPLSWEPVIQRLVMFLSKGCAR